MRAEGYIHLAADVAIGAWEDLGIVGPDPSDSKSKWLHVDIIRFFFHPLEANCIDSSKMIGNSPEASNFNRFICN